MEIKMPLIPGGKKGTVARIHVAPGDCVVSGQELVQVETAKGNRTVKAPCSGTVKTVCVREGDEVASEDGLLVLEEISGTGSEIKNGEQTDCAGGKITADITIIGGGPGGYVAALYAAKKGQHVVLIEQAALGGTCLNTGCIPTKTLIKSAEVYRTVKNAALFGIETGPEVHADMTKMQDRKNAVIKRLVDGIGFLMEKNNVKVLKGSGQFLNNTTIQVTGDKTYTVTAKDIIIATGSESAKLHIPGIDSKCVLDSTTALALRELPQSITIVGGGVIGLEFACMYRNLGSEVTVIEFLDRLVSVMDPELSHRILSSVRRMGITVHLSSKVCGIAESDDGKAVVTYEKNGKEATVTSDKILVATGRIPRITGFGLEKTTVELDERRRGIKTDDRMRTSVEHIWAVGDVNNKVQLAHAASYQGMIAIDNILGGSRTFDRTMVPSVVFTTPELADVGISETRAKDMHIPVTTGISRFAGNGKALAMNETDGYVKLVRNEKNIIIGGSVIGPDASTIISSIAIAVQNQLTDANLAETVFPHPTTGEALHEAALDFGTETLHQ